MACVVPWLGQGFHKWVHSLCGSFHKSLLGFCGFENLVNMGQLKVSGSTQIDGRCQEIGLVALMFFFELLFFLCFFAISLHVFLTNLFSIILFPYLLITQDTQDEGEAKFQFY